MDIQLEKKRGIQKKHLPYVGGGVLFLALVGWIVSSEEFMKDIRFLDFLKLDVSYGLSGNDDLQNYATRSYFNSINFMGSANGLILANYKNDKLKWETTGKAKFGVDLSMFNNRWSVRADFFTSTTKDLLIRKQLPETSSLEYSLTNDGKLKNKGFEIATNIRILNLRSWQLDFGAMLGHYKNNSFTGRWFIHHRFSGSPNSYCRE